MEQLDIFTELNFNLIQAIRLAHALVEAGCRLHVSPEVGAKLEVLHKIFGMQYVVGGEGVPILRGLLIDHERRKGQRVESQAAGTYCNFCICWCPTARNGIWSHPRDEKGFTTCRFANERYWPG